jgi:uncharacterized membrane protein YhfC
MFKLVAIIPLLLGLVLMCASYEMFERRDYDAAGAVGFIGACMFALSLLVLWLC